MTSLYHRTLNKVDNPTRGIRDDMPFSLCNDKGMQGEPSLSFQAFSGFTNSNRVSFLLVLFFSLLFAGCQPQNNSNGAVELASNNAVGSVDMALSLGSVTILQNTIKDVRLTVRSDALPNGNVEVYALPDTSRREYRAHLPQLPVGEYTIEAEAFSLANAVLAKGFSAPFPIERDRIALVAIVLQLPDNQPGYANQAPEFTSSTISSNEVDPGDSVALAVTAMGSANAVLQYEWRCETENEEACGGFSETTNSEFASSTVWTAPEETGLFHLTVTVTDQNQSEVQHPFIITVSDSDGTGEATVEIQFNKPPQITNISTNNRLAANETATITIEAIDPDLDSLVYTATVIANNDADCGTIAPIEDGTFLFTGPAQATSEECSLLTAASDQKGAQHLGVFGYSLDYIPTDVALPELNVFSSSLLVNNDGQVYLSVLQDLAYAEFDTSCEWTTPNGTITPVSHEDQSNCDAIFVAGEEDSLSIVTVTLINDETAQLVAQPATFAIRNGYLAEREEIRAHCEQLQTDYQTDSNSKMLKMPDLFKNTENWLQTPVPGTDLFSGDHSFSITSTRDGETACEANLHVELNRKNDGLPYSLSTSESNPELPAGSLRIDWGDTIASDMPLNTSIYVNGILALQTSLPGPTPLSGITINPDLFDKLFNTVQITTINVYEEELTETIHHTNAPAGHWVDVGEPMAIPEKECTCQLKYQPKTRRPEDMMDLQFDDHPGPVEGEAIKSARNDGQLEVLEAWVRDYFWDYETFSDNDGMGSRGVFRIFCTKNLPSADEPVPVQDCKNCCTKPHIFVESKQTVGGISASVTADWEYADIMVEASYSPGGNLKSHTRSGRDDRVEIENGIEIGGKWGQSQTAKVNAKGELEGSVTKSREITGQLTRTEGYEASHGDSQLPQEQHYFLGYRPNHCNVEAERRINWTVAGNANSYSLLFWGYEAKVKSNGAKAELVGVSWNCDGTVPEAGLGLEVQ